MKKKKGIEQTKSKKDEATLAKEVIEGLIEKGKKTQNVLSYEEVIEFSTQNHLSEEDTNALLSRLEQEHIELVMQEELDSNTTSSNIDEFGEALEASKAQLKEKFKSTFDDSDDDNEDTTKESVKEFADTSQISDSVKCYLRDIGKIPLLNKKTETIIATKISDSKR